MILIAIWKETSDVENATTPMSFKMFVRHRELDALDHARTEYPSDDGRPRFFRCQRLALKPGVTDGAGTFRMRELGTRLFATNEFVDLVERHRLSGLLVLPVWSEGEGPLAQLNGPRDYPGYTPPDYGGSRTERRATIREWLDGNWARQPGWR